MTNQGRKWIVAGACLDLLGAVLVATSLPEGGPRLMAGVAALVAGSFLVFQGVMRMAARRAAAAPRPEPPADWQPEPELTQPVPRRVELRRAGKYIVLLWGAMVIATPVYVFLAAPRGAEVDPLLVKHGETETATIHDKVVRGGPRGSAYYIWYHFDDQQGRDVRSSARVLKEVYDRLDVGDSVEVLYLPENPFTHTLPGISSGRAYSAAGIISVLVVAALVVIFEFVRRRHRQLTSEGVPIPGRIESLTRRGASRAYVLSVTVQGEERQLRGSERNVSLEEGDYRTVLYLPGEPRKVLIYPLSLYRAV